MNYPQIAAAELLETYADRLFLYCWSMLRSRETAQIVLRDTLLAAPADAAGARLYSLARAECGRHRPVPAADADEAPVCLGRNDADNRLVAWNAAMSLEPAESEALDLGTRHEVDLGQVLGLPAGQAQALLARARQNLERALGAEVLARRGHPCPDRAEVLAGWSGTMTPELRDRVLDHAAGCEACTGARPRNVSTARVFSLLPAPALSPQARAELLDVLTPPSPAEPPAPESSAALPPPVDLPLAALVQPPPSVAPLPSRVRPVPPAPAPRPIVPAPHPAAAGQLGGRPQPGADHRRHPAAAARPGPGHAEERRGPAGQPGQVRGVAGYAAGLRGQRRGRHRHDRPDHPHRDGRARQLVGQQLRAERGQPQQHRRPPGGRAERHADRHRQPRHPVGQRHPDLRLVR